MDVDKKFDSVNRHNNQQHIIHDGNYSTHCTCCYWAKKLLPKENPMPGKLCHQYNGQMCVGTEGGLPVGMGSDSLT